MTQEMTQLLDIPALVPFATKLEALGIESAEQFQAMSAISSREMRQFLGVSLTQLQSTAAAVPAMTIPKTTLDQLRKARYALGANIDHARRPDRALALPPLAATPTTTVNLIPQLPAVRDQGERGTCVAHAALATFEHSLKENGSADDLSEQFLYWNCKRNDGIPQESGTWLQVAMPLLERDGCCLETTWQYISTDVPGNEGQHPPPPGAQLEALSFRPVAVEQLAPNSIDDIKQTLASGRCVAFSVPVFNSWYHADTVRYTGTITNPVPGELSSGGHAMCLVGYADQDTPRGLGGGRFILRNSWGTSWAPNSPYGPGYGTIPYAYIARHCHEAFAIAP